MQITFPYQVNSNNIFKLLVRITYSLNSDETVCPSLSVLKQGTPVPCTILVQLNINLFIITKGNLLATTTLRSFAFEAFKT